MNDGAQIIAIETDEIRLDQFVKWSGAADSGARAKLLIQAGSVRVNGEVETRRGRRLIPGDVVSVEGFVYRLAGE